MSIDWQTTRGHICAIYKSDAQLGTVMREFFRAGLLSGERCVAIIDSADGRELLGTPPERLAAVRDPWAVGAAACRCRRPPPVW